MSTMTVAADSDIICISQGTTASTTQMASNSIYRFNNINEQFIYILNSIGDETSPCSTSLEIVKYSVVQVFHKTLTCCLVYASKRIRTIQKGTHFFSKS